MCEIRRCIKNGHFNFEYFYMNMKNYISTLKISHLNSKWLFSILKLILQVWKLIIDSKNGHFNFEIFYLNSKNLFDLKIDIWILNYYFRI